jgi:hypothetical protein
MAGHTLSKSTFIRARQCVKSLYLNKFHGNLRDRISPEQLAKFRRGTDIGKLARDLFPGGIDMSPRSPTQYQKKAEETASAMLNPAFSVIYEAVVKHNDVLIMLDILVRNKQGWDAYEVKSSLSVSETYQTDAALQYYVLNGAGIDILNFYLVFVNKDYIFEGELILHQLFTSISVIDQVKARLNEMESDIDHYKQILASGLVPEVPIGKQCHAPYPCDFIGHCWKNVSKTSILKLNAFPEAQLLGWFNEGIFEAEQIPSSMQLTGLQQKQIQSMVSHEVYWNKEELKKLVRPTRGASTVFMKTVLINPALPTRQGNKPYQPELLAIAITENGEQTEVFYFDQAKYLKSGSILQKINSIVNSYQHIILFDAPDFKQFMHFQHETEITEDLSNKIFDLKEALSALDFYHPQIDNYTDFDEVTRSMLQTKAPLKNETYLVSDLLATPEGNYFIKNSLSQYVKYLYQLYNLFNFQD